MRVKFTGDFAALQAFADKIRRAPDALKTVNQQLAEEAIALTHEGIQSGTDPYGKPYPEPKLRGGKPLQDTGRLMAGWHARAAGKTGFTIGNPVKYAGYMQEGTGIYGPKRTPIRPKNGRFLRIPVRGSTGGLTSAKGFIYAREVKGAEPRKMVPDGNNLPSKWKARFVETAHDVLTELFR